LRRCPDQRRVHELERRPLPEGVRDDIHPLPFLPEPGPTIVRRSPGVGAGRAARPRAEYARGSASHLWDGKSIARCATSSAGASTLTGTSNAVSEKGAKKEVAMPTDAAQRALGILRDGAEFQWYVVPLLALVLYVYAVEVERRSWSVVFAGLAVWGMDWFNEIWNALVFHFTQYAPLWSAPARTAYLILIGLNIEICFMFAIAGVVAAKTLPSDPRLRILGVPNRWFIAIAFSVFSVIVEIVLNAAGQLTWDYWWWNVRTPWLIIVFGYLTFYVVAFWVHDMPTVKQKATTVTAIYAFDLACLVLFGGVLGWI
jgi:hypothetical protein